MACTDLIFSFPDGRPFRPNSVTRAFQAIAKSVGLESARLHDLRHAHATILLQQGVHPKIVQERLSHSSVATTLDIYSHVLPGLQEAAARQLEEGLQGVSPETQANGVTRQNVGTLALRAGFGVESEARRGDREADGAALEKRSPLVGAWVRIPPSPRRGAGVDYQARLESACRLGDRGFESHPLRHSIYGSPSARARQPIFSDKS